MEVQTMFRGAGSVLVLGIVLITIGVIVPEAWAIAQLCRGVGVVVTLMGMVGMVAERQSRHDGHQLAHPSRPQSSLE